MRSRHSHALAVVGLAILSLTPASPSFLRELDVAALHAFRAVEWVLDAARRDSPSPSARPEVRRLIQRAREGLRRWDDVLTGGARRLAPERIPRVARIVAVEAGSRRILVDAGRTAGIAPGDPVLAGDIAIGRVARVEGGVVVVDTPWRSNARFAAASRSAAGEEIRFVTVGLERGRRLATVSSPDHRAGLLAGREVYAPHTEDLLPASVPVLPAGCRIGVLEEDRELEATEGERGFVVRPLLDVAWLDAVVILSRELAVDPGGAEDDAFRTRPCDRLRTGLLSPWRDGGAIFGPYLADGAAITAGGFLIGVVRDSLLGAARVRGVGDPGNEFPVLVVPEDEPYPVRVRALRWRRGRVEFELVRPSGPTRVPRVGDLLVSAGRGRQVPRGLPIGSVVRVSGAAVEVVRPDVGPFDAVEIHLRPGFPLRPWGP